MKKHFLFAALLVAAVCGACSKEKAACQKVMYKIGETEVTTYQWMTPNGGRSHIQ